MGGDGREGRKAREGREAEGTGGEGREASGTATASKGSLRRLVLLAHAAQGALRHAKRLVWERLRGSALEMRDRRSKVPSGRTSAHPLAYGRCSRRRELGVGHCLRIEAWRGSWRQGCRGHGESVSGPVTQAFPPKSEAEPTIFRTIIAPDSRPCATRRSSDTDRAILRWPSIAPRKSSLCRREWHRTSPQSGARIGHTAHAVCVDSGPSADTGPMFVEVAPALWGRIRATLVPTLPSWSSVVNVKPRPSNLSPGVPISKRYQQKLTRARPEVSRIRPDQGCFLARSITIPRI